MTRTIASAAVLLMLLAGCGTEPAEGPVNDDPASPAEPTPDADADGDGEERASGAFDGSAELEGGCAWLVADDGAQYEVIYPAGYEVSFDPLELRGPDGEVVAEQGDEVTVTGRVATDRMSICQVGTIFEADTVQR